MSIEVTKRATLEVRKVMEDQKMDPEESYLRVAVAGGGCSGFSYKLTFERKKDVDSLNDTVYEFEGVKAVVDKKSEIYLEGVTVDFYEGLDKRGFVFDNPSATKSCGCGQSFNV